MKRILISRFNLVMLIFPSGAVTWGVDRNSLMTSRVFEESTCVLPWQIGGVLDGVAVHCSTTACLWPANSMHCAWGSTEPLAAHNMQHTEKSL